ncbi:MAG TPA: LysR family transcriptional regulator substrate-binding protein [Galbitalea sp.]|nr:LysR family transcriptional regulator substrate-binding protein [Galbitalea sp.]
MNELQRGVEAARGRMNDWPIRARIGVHPIVSSSFVANVLRELQTHHPGFAVELIEGTSARLEEMLTSGDADLALQPAHSRSPAASLSYRSIWSEQVVAVMKDHDDLADRPSVTFDDLSKRTLVFGAPGVSGNKGSPDQRSATARSNNELGGSLFTEQPATLIALVHSDFGIGIINCLALETTRLDGLAVLPIGSGSSRREMAWYWLEARSGAPSVRALLDCVVSVAPPTGAAAIG